MGSRSLHANGQFEGLKWPAQDMPGGRCTKSDSTGGSTGTVWMPIGVYYVNAHWRHLGNTTEPPVCGGDAASRQITLSICYYDDNSNQA